MAPTVIADIEARGLSKHWDRLAIVANCCQYPLRLNGGALSRQRRSPSLSILAMCLINGEILNNSDDDTSSVATLTTSELLKRLMFCSFTAPEGDMRRLTFNKGRRLFGVKLTTCGLATSGHLWKLGPTINTTRFRRRLPWIDEPNGRLTLGDRKRLLQLVFNLHDMNQHWLAKRIDEYLSADAQAGEEYHFFTDMYLHRMAAEVAAAILARRKLMLGRIWDKSLQDAPYRAIFVCPALNSDVLHLPTAFVFTSARPDDSGSRIYGTNDLDCYASLEVDKGSTGLGRCATTPRSHVGA